MNYGPVVPNSAGPGCTIGWTGSTSIKDNAFTLSAAGMPPHKAGQFAYGSQSTTATPFGNGYRLIGGSIFQIETIVTADASGNATLELDFTVPPLSSGAGTVLAGVTWYFQLAYLDPAAGGQGFNLSNGLMTTFCP